MKRLSALALLIVISSGLLFTQALEAAQFSSSYIRLDRTKSNTALSGLVCAKPSSAGAGTEAKVTIQFPSDFTINSTLSNFTTNTSDIPSGATAWPSIGGSASGISGLTVTISGGDLTSGSSLYCFNFTAISSTTGSTGSKTGTITTKNSSDGTIDTSDYAFSITSNDQITVSATVPANSSDYSNSISKVTTGTQFAEDTEIEYQLTYGSELSFATQISIEASWSQGTIEGDSTPSVEVLNYVSGSADDAYSSTPPVIDSVNKTITWDISSFPGNTSGQTVNFKLKTTNNYTGSSRVSFTTSGRILFSGGATSYSNQSSYYKYSTSFSSSSSSPTSTPTPTPLLGNTDPKIQSVEIRTISSTGTSIYIETSTPTTKIVRYGKSPLNLTLQQTSALSTSSLINLNELDPNTQYFFRIYTTDANNRRTISDIYTFKTASGSDIPEIDQNSFVAISNNVIVSLSNGQTEEKLRNNFLLIPQSTVFQFKFALKGKVSAKKIQIIVRNKNVLGFNTFATSAQASTEVVELVEIEPGVYSGSLKTKSEPGNYEIVARIIDINGNITEQKMADLKITRPLSIFSLSKKPIENAKVTLFVFNEKSKLFTYIPPDILSIVNPSYSGTDGSLNLVLSQGKYKAEITALGYKEKIVEFTIGQGINETYPQIYLESEQFNLITYFKYHLNTFWDFINQTRNFVQGLSTSIRFFELNALLAGALLSLLLISSLSNRIRIPLHSFIEYILHSGKVQFIQKKLGEKIKGRVFDQDEVKGLSDAQVYLIDSEKNKIVSQTKTDKSGDFSFIKLSDLSYKIEVMKQEYEPVIFNESEIQAVGLGGYQLTIQKHNKGISLKEKLKIYMGKTLSLTFESLLVLSFIFEFSMGLALGWIKVLPFFVFSLINLSLWINHLSHLRSEKNIF